MKVSTKAEYRVRRHLRLRKKVAGTAARPRMSVYVSNKHIYVQFIDDGGSRTLCSVSTVAGEGKGSVSVETAKKLGLAAARVAAEKGITTVVFDRGGFRFGGRLKALADAAREQGLKF